MEKNKQTVGRGCARIHSRSSSKSSSKSPSPSELAAINAHIALIELIYFAYRDFVSEADVILGETGLGRAHHRALHFICRHPAISSQVLADRLRVSRQSLSRVLGGLKAQACIEVCADRNDRRRMCLYPTETGLSLLVHLARVQARNVGQSWTCLSPDGREGAIDFLKGLIGGLERNRIMETIARGHDLRLAPRRQSAEVRGRRSGGGAAKPPRGEK